MIQLNNRDCMAAMAEMKDNAFELSICDPPYGINITKSFIRKTPAIDPRNGRPIKTKYTRRSNWDKNRPTEDYFKELIRVSENQIIWGGNYFSDLLKPSSCWIVWDKVNGKSDQADCEIAWTSFKTAVRLLRYKWTGLLQGKGVINGTITQGNNKLWEKRIHPTQKPAKLYEWLLKNYAKEGDKILDTHLGSGSIAIACHDYGFDLTGYEIDKDYFDAATKRLKQHQAQLTLQM